MKSVGSGVHELKINFQKAYRIYFTNINGEIILLLCGGDKSSQDKDIQKAKELKGAL
ncbi:MAG: type II toxin-antitoxin system RelE/ParE family toxin [Endomicrobium sp.]|jgi:putative addiction module killer protein|nr:type II toxin-antitoxin system RelE/ParE family toxin [Endomicrobium sp.]